MLRNCHSFKCGSGLPISKIFLIVLEGDLLSSSEFMQHAAGLNLHDDLLCTSLLNWIYPMFLALTSFGSDNNWEMRGNERDYPAKSSQLMLVWGFSTKLQFTWVQAFFIKILQISSDKKWNLCLYLYMFFFSIFRKSYST